VLGTNGRGPALNHPPPIPCSTGPAPNLRRPIPVCTPVPFPVPAAVVAFTRWPDSQGPENTETGLSSSAGGPGTQTSSGTLSQTATAA
jgi:hypothetical protein